MMAYEDTEATRDNGNPARGENNSAMVRVPIWRIPWFLKPFVPEWVLVRLREMKIKALLRKYPRDIEYVQTPEDRAASASMSIIVPIHDAPEVTRRCLASLEKYAPEAEVILVDDASALPETLETIRYFGGRVGWSVIRHEEALGHSEGCRAGARLATRPYLCLLNSDTVVTPWCWRGITDALESDAKIGAAGPSTSDSWTVQSLEMAGYLSAYWNDNQICAFAKNLLTEFQEPAIVDLPWVSGFAFFIRRSLWEELGGFDPELPDYGNEIDLCARLEEKGYRRVWVRNVYIHHFARQSYKQVLGSEDAVYERSRAAEAYAAEKRKSSAR